MKSKFLSAKEAAEYLGVSYSTVQRFASEGTIPGFKLGKQWRFNQEELDKFAEEGVKKWQNSGKGRNG